MNVQLVVFDWAGTVIDFGSCAPAAAFVAVFAKHGLTVSATEARGPMGTHKKDHLRRMLEDESIRQRWRQRHGRDWVEPDLEAMYRQLVPLQMDTIREHAALVPTVVDVVAELRQRGLKIGGTTGYFREAAALCAALAEEQGYRPDANVCGDDVPTGRPAPWMVYRIMEQLGTYPPASVVKVGDTLVDIEEGLNAGCWSGAVLASSSELGLSAPEYAALPAIERDRRLAELRERFLRAGAHFIVDDLAELPTTLDEINSRLARGEKP